MYVGEGDLLMRTVNERIVDAVSTLLLALSFMLSLSLVLTLMTYRIDTKAWSPVTVVDPFVTNAAKEKA
jgi:hypothetical protein